MLHPMLQPVMQRHDDGRNSNQDQQHQQRRIVGKFSEIGMYDKIDKLEQDQSPHNANHFYNACIDDDTPAK